MQAEKMPSIKLTRSDLDRLTNAIESSRMKLFSNAEVSIRDVKKLFNILNEGILYYEILLHQKQTCLKVVCCKTNRQKVRHNKG